MAAQAQPNIDNQESMILLWSKLIRETDLNYRLSFPTKFVKERFPKLALPVGGATEMAVWDVKSQRLRNFKCRTREGKHPKPVVSGRSWRGFVQENELKVGDRILFFEEVADDPGVRFRIDLERATTNIEPAAPAGTSTSTSTTTVGSLTTLASDQESDIGMDDDLTALKLSIN